MLCQQQPEQCSNHWPTHHQGPWQQKQQAALVVLCCQWLLQVMLLQRLQVMGTGLLHPVLQGVLVSLHGRQHQQQQQQQIIR
jgi:hypothetical protein